MKQRIPDSLRRWLGQPPGVRRVAFGQPRPLVLRTAGVVVASAWMWERAGRRVIAGLEEHNGETWLHASLSRPDHMPDYRDLLDLRRRFFLDALYVVQVFPPRAEHVNVHGFCLHLWSRVDPPGFMAEVPVAVARVLAERDGRPPAPC